MNMIENAVFIISRLSSERVPKKNLIKLDGIPMLSRLHKRLKMAKSIDKIIVCTSTDVSDDPLEDYCNKNNILVGRGSLNNVMERICSVADKFNVKNIFEVLGDNPFIHYSLIDKAADIFRKNNYDYVANYSNDYRQVIKTNKFPVGVRVQVYSTKKAQEYGRKDITHLAHPCSFLYANPDFYKINLFGAVDEFSNISGCSDLNISVNYLQNVNFADHIFRKFGNNVEIPDILNEIKHNPDLIKLISQANG